MAELYPRILGPLTKRFLAIWVLACLLAAFTLPIASAASLDGTPWFMQPELLGDWGGLRPRLIDWGVTPTAFYTTDLLGNPVGGQRQRFRYAGDFSVYLNFDLEKLLDLQGLQLNLSASWRSGEDLSEDIGNEFTVAQIFGGDTVRLYELSFEQSYDDFVSVRIGRIGLGDDFLTSPLYGAFVNTAFNSNPSGVPINLPGFSVDPVATWGGRVSVQPTEALYVMAGVYNSNPGIERNSAHGVDFGAGRGALMIAEIGYSLNQDEGALGMPGAYKFGWYYDTSPFPGLSGPPDTEVHGNYGFYVLADQMVYREGGAESQQGLTPFIGLTFAPSDKRNPFPFFAMGGLVYQGLFPGRDYDTTSFGAAFGKYSEELDDQDFELVLEWRHAFVLGPSLTVQPDVQYIIKPGGTDDISNALVLGAQLTLNFGFDRRVDQRLVPPARGGLEEEEKDARIAARSPAPSEGEYPVEVQSKQVAQEPSDPVAAYTVQVGAFQREENAQRIASELRTKGYDSYILITHDATNRVLRRVCIGYFTDKGQAKTTEEAFKAKENKDAYVLLIDASTPGKSDREG